MRSDAKLGIALGMLVAGFAIAFCFPREGHISVAQQVVLNQEPAHSEEIEFVPIRELRADLTEPENAAEDSATDDFVTSDQSYANAAPAPQLDPTDAEVGQPNAARSLQSLLAEDEPVDLQPQPSHQAQTEVENLTYLVQPGDTLSEISMKTLGSYRRYLDIYEANRDQLDSPDDLRLGMILKIPAETKSPESLVAEQSQVDEVLPPDVDPATTKQPADRDKRFGSAGRRPFLTDRNPHMPVHQIPAQQTRTHVVERGDTLERIAVRYFGTVRAIRQIHAANPGLLDDPNQLKPGSVLNLVP